MSINVNPEDDFHVVINGNVMALKLDDLDDFYQMDVISEESLIWQQGLGEWMRLDTVLAELAKHEPVAPAPEVEDDVYFVLVAPEEVKQMSLDLLNDAYRLEVIDDDTLVWQPGFTEWIPLSVLIGDEPEEHYSLAPSMAPAPTDFDSGFGAASAPFSAPVPFSAPAPHSSTGFSSGFSAPPSSSFGISAPPVALSVPLEPPAASPWFGRTLLFLTAAAAVFALYRNGVGADTVQDFADGKEMAAQAGRDTPHGLQTWLDELNAQYELDDLSETDPVPAKVEAIQPAEEVTTSKVPTEEKKDAAQPAGAQSPQSADKDKAKDTEEAKDAAGKEATPENEAAQAFGSKLGNEPAPVKKRATAPVRTYKKTSSSKGKLPSSGDRYDPMNGAL